MPEGEAGFVPEEATQPENAVENIDKAQLEANLVRFKALQRAANDEFERQSPHDYQMLSVCRDYQSYGLKMSPEQRDIWLELEGKLDKVRADVISGKIPIEPTRSDYEEASDHYERMSEWRNERGVVGRAICDMLMSIAKKGATKTLRTRSDNIESQAEANN